MQNLPLTFKQSQNTKSRKNSLCSQFDQGMRLILYFKNLRHNFIEFNQIHNCKMNQSIHSFKINSINYPPPLYIRFLAYV